MKNEQLVKIKKIHENYLEYLQNKNRKNKEELDLFNKELKDFEDFDKFYTYVEQKLLELYEIKVSKIESIIFKNKVYKNPDILLSNLSKNPYLFILDSEALITFDKCEKIRILEKLNIDRDIISKAFCHYYIICENPNNSFYVDKYILLNKMKKYGLGSRNLDLVDIKINKKIYTTTKFYYEKEKNMTDLLIDMFTPDDIETLEASIDDIYEYEKEKKIDFTKEQRETILECYKNRFQIICGYPGTGKTTIVECVLSLFEKYNYSDDFKDKISLIAPTGLAVCNLKKNCAKLGISNDMICTIHKFLNKQEFKIAFGGNVVIQEKIDKLLIDLENGKNVINKIKFYRSLLKDPEVIVIDETSMIDLLMFERILRVVKDLGCRLILLGDDNQLAPVGPGNTLQSIIDSKIYANYISKLTDIKRQNGLLKDNIVKINEDKITLKNFNNDSFKFIDYNLVFGTYDHEKYKKDLENIEKMKYQLRNKNTPRDNLQSTLLELKKLEQDILKFNNDLNDSIFEKLKKFIQINNINNVNTQFITCQRTYCAGYENMNMILQKIFNETGSIIEPEIKAKNSFRFKVGDKVYRTENSYSEEDNLRANGETGTIKQYITQKDDCLVDSMDEMINELIIIDHGDGDLERISVNQLYEDFTLGYCKTIHKTQGSQYENIVLLMSPIHSYMWLINNDSKKLFYTAISRAKKKVFVIGTEELILGSQKNKGNTNISLFLREGNKYSFIDEYE